MLNLTLRQMQVFSAVARNLSYTAAAKELHLSQPGVSMQVRQLEEAIGLPLFEQLGKKTYLTEAGKRVAEACKGLFERIEQLEQELAMLQGVENGRVRVAIITTAEYFVPELLGRFCARHPSIEVSLFVGNRDQLLERIKNNDDDLYIIGRPPKGMPVQAEVFAENPLVMVAPPDHPLVNAEDIEPELIADEPFILREPGSGTRLTVLEFFKQHRIEPRVHMELGSNEAIKQCVMAGLGVAVLSFNNLQQELTTGRIAVLDVKGFPLKRNWYLIQLQNKVLLPSARAFREFLLSEELETFRKTAVP